MSGWSSNGRAVLFEALGAAWDQIDADITKGTLRVFQDTQEHNSNYICV